MQSKIIKTISIIGSGNMAFGLAPFFRNNGVEIVEVYSTNQSSGAEFAKEFNCTLLKTLDLLYKNSDLYLIAIPDKEIEKLVTAFPEVNGIVAHTSGIVSISVLRKFSKYGVFYPLQTFTKGLKVDISNVPICVEASTEEVEKELKILASELSRSILLINSEKRKKLHLAAVLVSNFSNLLFNFANELLEKNDLEFKLLIPLMEESVRKVQYLKPKDAQTGPAKRNDLVTIEEHLGMLAGFPEIQNVYSLLSEQIRTLYHE